MAICPECRLGIPPFFEACPDCGQAAVELARDEAAEDEAVAVSNSPVLVDLDEQDPELAPYTLSAAADAQTADDLPLIGEPSGLDDLDDEPPSDAAEIEDETGPDSAEAQQEEPEVDHLIGPMQDEDEELPEVVEVRDEAEDPGLEADEDFSEPEEQHDDNLLWIEDEDDVVTTPGELAQDADVATPITGAQLAKLEALIQQSAREGTRWKQTVRWAQRAYRGDVDVGSTTSSGVVTTVAVFGDGLLLIDSRSVASELKAGAAGGLISAAGGSRARKRRKIFSLAGSSAQAASRLKGSRRLTLPEIEVVHIEKGHGWARNLTISTTSGEQLQYRYPANRHRHLVALLTPVLGDKLRDGGRGKRKTG